MSPPDAVLLERWIQSRDAEAFHEIVTRHAGLVFGTCRRILRNRADAEDVAQDCFLKLARAASPPRSSLEGWLHTAAVRGAVDYLRSKVRRRRREERFAKEHAIERRAATEWRELEEHVDACIAELPEKLREPLIAHFLLSKTHEAIAAELGVSRQTVTRRIGLGVERLRRLLVRRGIAAPLAAFATVLEEGLAGAAAEIPPATLTASLGRIALSGLTTAPVVPCPATASVLVSLGGFLMATKVLVSSAAAVILFLAGLLAIWRPWALDAPRPSAAEPVAGAHPVSSASVLDARRERGGLVQEPGRDGAGEQPARGTAMLAVTGRVFDSAGDPVPRAVVRIAAESPGEPRALAEAVTDAGGRFRVEEIAPPEGELFAAALEPAVGLGALALAPGDLVRGEQAGGELAVELVLEPLCEVGGRVYDREHGAGIAAFPVVLTRTDPDEPSGGSRLLTDLAPRLFSDSVEHGLLGRWGRVLTDAGGRYLARAVGPVKLSFGFDAAATEYVVPGFRGGDRPPALALEAGERRLDIDFALARGGSIAGRVLGPDGEGVPGAQVELVSSFVSPYRRTAACDEHGAYRFGGLEANARYLVHAWHEDLAAGASSPVAMPVAQEVAGVDVRLSWGHAIAGRVIDETGAAAGGIRLSLERRFEASAARGGFGPVETAADGSFAFERVGPGEYALRTDSPEHDAARFELSMPADRDLFGLEFELRRRAPGFIAGRLVDEHGAPVKASVQVWRNGRRAGYGASGEDGS